MANSKRSNRAETVNEFADKGYCASKGVYYYGVKVHIAAIKRAGRLPLPDFTGLTPAADRDLTVFRQIAAELQGVDFYADKSYTDACLKQYLKENKD